MIFTGEARSIYPKGTQHVNICLEPIDYCDNGEDNGWQITANYSELSLSLGEFLFTTLLSIRHPVSYKLLAAGGAC